MACGGDDTDKKESPAKTDTKKDDKKDAEGSVGCGPKVCTPEKGFMGQLCCRSNFDGVCGQMVAGTCTDLPPPADERCKSTTFMAGSNTVMVPSCCNASNNQCGLVFNAGIGAPMCTTISQAKMFGARFMTMSMMGNMMFNFTGNLPDAVTCDGEPVEATAGAAGSGSM
jgi:hypothetical protein